jgi:hypothetical protein
MGENHYQALGLELTASTSSVRAALERLVEEAQQATRKDPDRARVLWNQVRAIRRDLLSGRETREAYDLKVLSAMPVQSVSVPTPERYIRPERPRIATSSRAGSHRWPWAAAGVTAVLLSLILAGALARQLTNHSAATPPPVSISGTVASGSPFQNGEQVVLQWKHVTGARQYRIRLWTSSSASAKVISVARPSYRMRVVGAQKYFWRVQALFQGRWTAYGPTSDFAVGSPPVGRPVALSVPSSSRLRPGNVTLCWKPVLKAIEYHLTVSGIAPRTVRSSCTRIPVGAGRHRWTVAAVVRGAKNYVGPRAFGSFLVRRPSRHVVIARASTSRRRHALVAAAQPIQSTSSLKSYRSPSTTSAATTSAVIAQQPADRVPSVGRRALATRRSTPARVPTAPSRPRPTTVVRRSGPPPPPPPPPPASRPAPAGHASPVVSAPASRSVATPPSQTAAIASNPPLSLPSLPAAAPTVVPAQPTAPPTDQEHPGKSGDPHGRGRGKNHKHP